MAHLDSLLRNGAFKFSDTFFPYTSGEVGPYFVNAENVMNNGADYKMATDALARSIVGLEGDLISGGETRDWFLSAPVATNLVMPHLAIYKDGSFRPSNADPKGKRVIHVADLNNEGSSPRETWIPTIRENGGEIEHIFFYVDRMERGVQVMKDLGLQRHAIVELDGEAWDYLKSNEVIDDWVYRNLRERMEDQDAWGIRMLRSDKGVARLKALYEDPKTREKVEKVLDYEGYSGIRDELTWKLGIGKMRDGGE